MTDAPPSAPTIDHPALVRVKEAMPGRKLFATEFRSQTTLIVGRADLHEVMRFLRDDPACDYEFLSDVTAVDYLDYPAKTMGRFAVVYNLICFGRDDRLIVKVFLDPSGPTEGNDIDPELTVASITDIWPGAEWPEREVYDMYGISFENHPDLRRILTWTDFPAFPLRKDYPLRGRGERESYRLVDRTSS